jgi:hypothetical protein
MVICSARTENTIEYTYEKNLEEVLVSKYYAADYFVYDDIYLSIYLSTYYLLSPEPRHMPSIQ